jgi:periplasmic protein TonB
MSDLVNLSQCMVDSNAAANPRALLLRGKALAASLFLEAVAIAGVLLWPLATLGVLPPQLISTPLPIYHGEHNSRPAPPHQVQQPPARHPRIDSSILRQPPVIPPHVSDSSGPVPPSIDTVGDGSLEGASGSWISGGGDSGQPIEIARPRPERKPRMVSIGVMDGSLLHRVEPDYPKVAKMMHLSGTVILRATIGTDGEVHEIEILRGNPILAQAARDAVRQWRYRPTLLDGQPVEVETQMTVNFVLE